MNGNNVKKNLVRKELPVCTKVEHLKQWEKFMKEHPNSDYLNMTIFDLYYYQVMYDYLVTTALETVDDGQELIKLNKKYLELFPNGIYVENVSNVISTVEKSVEEYKKYLEEFALEQARKRAREIARQREYERQREYNNSSSNSSNTNNEISITKDNVMRYVDKIETQTEHSYNTIYRVYYSNGEEALIKYESGKWYYDCGALTGWSKASSKASAIYYAYKWRDSW